MFKFELNSVLSLKEKVEDNKKRELNVANTQKENLEQQKHFLNAQHQNICEGIKKNTTEDFNLQVIQTLNRYSIHIKKQLQKTELDLVQSEKIVNQKRSELLQAVKERKILENLKEIKRESYLIESKKVEQVLVDEMVSYKYAKLRRRDV